MKTTVTIKIKKRTQLEWLTWLMIMLPFAYGALIDLFHLPNAVKFVSDIAWLCILIVMIRFSRVISWKSVRGPLICMGVFLAFTVVCQLFLYQSLFYYIWGLRNNFRFYVFFLACAVFLTEESALDCLKVFDKLFWINAAVSLFQFFVLKTNGDYLGGIFGTEKGCNQYTIAFCTIALIKAVVFYLNKKDKLSSCIAKGAVSFLIAAIAELKVFFVVAVFIIVAALLFSEVSARKLWIILAGIVGIVFGVSLLSTIFSDGSISWFKIEHMLAVVTSDKGYTSSGDLNRFTAITQINEMFFKDWPSRLFGFGLGNCDTSNIAACNTPFFKMFSYLHYSWFSSAMVYLETGYIGLTFYMLMFAMCFIYAWRRLKKGSANHLLCQMTMIMAPLCFLFTFYNASLRVESAYMIYFILALPFIQNKRLKVRRRRYLN